MFVFRSHFSFCCVLQVNGGIENTLKKEVAHYDYYSSYFDIFVRTVTSRFRYNEMETKRPGPLK